MSLRGLDRAGLPRDVIAGITVAAIAIPEGLGYAKIVGLPIETGLYCALLPPVLFALLGSSRQLIVGADSATAALVAAGAGAVAAVGTAQYASSVAVLGLLVAVFLVLIALAGLDFLADLISQPVLAGFLSGVGISLMIGKLPGMLGIEASGTTWDKLVGTVTHIDEVNTTSAVLAIGTVVVMLALEERLPKVPAALVALAAASVAGVLMNAESHAVAMVGAIPSGLPGLALPTVDASQISRMVAPAASIAVVILAQSAAVSRSFALQNSYEVSIRKDLFGLAAANLGSAVGHGFAINGSPPRTAAADGAGGRSQVVNLAQAATVALVLVFLTGLFNDIPSPVLDAVVFAIGFRLIKVATLRAVGRARSSELLVALVAMLVVAFVGVEQGILLAIVLALIDRLRRQYRPHYAVLIEDGQVASRLRLRIPLDPQHLEGVLVFRFGAPLFFENATYFSERVRALLAGSKTPVRVLVLDCAAMEDVDFTGAHTLAEVSRELRSRGGDLVVTEMTDDVVRMLVATGVDRDLTIVARLEQAVLVGSAAATGDPAQPDPPAPGLGAD